VPAEMRGFVFGVTFIVVFSVLISTIPVGLQGSGTAPDMLTPLDINIVTGFSASEDYVRTDFGGAKTYSYTLGERAWLAVFTTGPVFLLAAKVLIAGILWLGHLEICKFISPTGEDRGESLTLEEIEADATEGIVRYSLQYVDSGLTAGGYVIYWNTTAYSDPSDAWYYDELYLLHGIGIEDIAVANIGSLLVSLLLLQLPEVPLLINILLIAPIWASILFIIWYIIKEMIPFL